MRMLKGIIMDVPKEMIRAVILAIPTQHRIMKEHQKAIIIR